MITTIKHEGNLYEKHHAAGKLGTLVGRIGLLNSNSPRANRAEIVNPHATRVRVCGDHGYRHGQWRLYDRSDHEPGADERLGGFGHQYDSPPNPWMYIDYASPGMAKRFYRAVGTNLPPTNMVLIPAGSFTMGDTFNDVDSSWGERPTHTVYVSAFSMDKYEVTKALWDEVKTWAVAHGYSFDNAGSGKGANHPVQTVNWYDVVKWCNARSEKEGRVPAYYTDAAQKSIYKTGQVSVQNGWVKWNSGYRLPTEAEWEKAARGGTSGHRFPWSNVDTITHSQANYDSDSSYSYDLSSTRGYHPSYDNDPWPYTSPVGSFAPNGYGLYDMAGNVWEWCWDWWNSSYYSSSPGSDPRGPASGSDRVARGGSWASYAFDCRVAFRGGFWPGFVYGSFGFRSVLPPGQ